MMGWLTVVGRCLTVVAVACAASLAASASPAALVAQQREAAAVADDNEIRFGDAVRVRIFPADLRDVQLEPELRLSVDEAGDIVLPRLGRRAIGGSSAAAARQALTAELEDVFPNSVIEVTILRRVLVHGAVQRPGSYLLASYEATIGDAIAAAEGIAPEGRTNLVRVLRDDRVLPVRLGGSERLAAFTLRSGDEVVVPERGWITREPALAAALLSSAVTLLVTLIIVAQ